MKRWWFHYSGLVYAGNVYGHNETEARAALRASLGVDRLPRGTTFWR